MTGEVQSWSGQIRTAVLEEDRRLNSAGEIVLREVRVLDEHQLELRFVPTYLDGREVILVIDGTRRFAEEFLADRPEYGDLALKDWPIEELAWRIHLLGMREPFDGGELARDAEGRWIRLLTS